MKINLLIILLFFVPLLGFSQTGSKVTGPQNITADIHPNERMNRPAISDNHHAMINRFRAFGAGRHMGNRARKRATRRRIERRDAFRVHHRRM